MEVHQCQVYKYANTRMHTKTGSAKCTQMFGVQSICAKMYTKYNISSRNKIFSFSDCVEEMYSEEEVVNRCVDVIMILKHSLRELHLDGFRRSIILKGL